MHTEDRYRALNRECTRIKLYTVPWGGSAHGKETRQQSDTVPIKGSAHGNRMQGNPSTNNWLYSVPKGKCTRKRKKCWIACTDHGIANKRFLHNGTRSQSLYLRTLINPKVGVQSNDPGNNWEEDNSIAESRDRSNQGAEPRVHCRAPLQGEPPKTVLDTSLRSQRDDW